MTNKTIIGVGIAVIILGGFIWSARPSSQDRAASVSLSENSPDAFSVEEKSFDFGSVSMAAGNVTYQFKIKNKSEENITLSKLYTSCMCTIASLVKNEKQFGPYGMPGHGFIPKINEIMQAGEEAVVSVTFDPAAHGPAGVGRIERVITLEGESGILQEFSISATVTP